MTSCRSTYPLLIVALGCHLAFSVEFKVTVRGGEEDARNVPVRVAMDMDKVDSLAVSLSSADLNLFGQLTRRSVLAGDGEWELVFVLPHLPANDVIQLTGKTISDEQIADSFQFVGETGKYSELQFGGRPVLRYMHEAIDRTSPQRLGETYKVFHHVYDPTGSRYVTKGPGGLYPHHRGLFFGFNRISYGDKQADIWHCSKGEHQAHREFLHEETGPVLGRQLLAIDWHGQDDSVFAKETRELTNYNVEGGVLIEFASILTSQIGKVRLDGDPQHAGFQFRGSQDIPEKTANLTYYLRPDGKGAPGEFRNWSAKENTSEQDLQHIDLPWNAMSFVLDDKRYTCCYLDHPDNPKPARFSERDYGRFGSYFEYDLDTDNPLKLNYRIWLQQGEMTVAEVNEISQNFVSPPAVQLTMTGQ